MSLATFNFFYTRGIQVPFVADFWRSCLHSDIFKNVSRLIHICFIDFHLDGQYVEDKHVTADVNVGVVVLLPRFRLPYYNISYKKHAAATLPETIGLHFVMR